jgi:hypothetical protein
MKPAIAGRRKRVNSATITMLTPITNKMLALREWAWDSGIATHIVPVPVVYALGGGIL